MRILRLVATGTVLLVGGGCGDSGSILDPAQPVVHSSELAVSRAQGPDVGRLRAVVDFSTLTLTPKGRNCLLQADGQLNFTGTIVGEAVGQTTALVFARCSDVAAAAAQLAPRDLRLTPPAC